MQTNKNASFKIIYLKCCTLIVVSTMRNEYKCLKSYTKKLLKNSMSKTHRN